MAVEAGAFWSFSLAVYDNPAVQDECLRLQDEHGVDVNLLLFCAYLGAQHGAIVPGDALRAAAEIVRPWQNLVVANLRATRRALKSFAAEGLQSATALRVDVKKLELEAEQVEQAILEEWGLTRRGEWPRAKPEDAIQANIKTLLSEFATQRPDPPRHLIAAALENTRRRAH